MPYDPNDPNQGSQAPGYEGDPYKGGMSLDALIKSRPGVQAFLAAHNDGKNLSGSDEQQLFSLIQSQGIDTKMLELDNDGTFNAGTGHTLRDIAMGSLLAFGPVAAAWAIPAISGGTAAGSAGAAAGAGPATGATTAAATGASTAAGAATTAAGAGGGSSVLADLLKYGVPTVGGIVGGIIQANATGNATAAQQAYLKEALDYQKAQDAIVNSRNATLDAQNYAQQQYLDKYNAGQDQYKNETAAQHYANNVSTEGSRYKDYAGNVSPFIGTGQAANARMASLLKLDPSVYKQVLNTPTLQSAPALPTQPTSGVAGQPTAAATPAMITIQSPDGATKQVPASEADHWISVGAKVLQGTAA